LFFPCDDAAVNVDRTTNDLQYGWWEIRKPLYLRVTQLPVLGVDRAVGRGRLGPLPE
jgi:hypothetical protein